MITKQFRIALALLALVALASVAVSAGQVVLRKVEPVKMATSLRLELCFGPRVCVINNTSSAIPKDTTIYWSITDSKNHSKTGSFTLPAPLLPDRGIASPALVDFTGMDLNPFKPLYRKAWYFK